MLARHTARLIRCLGAANFVSPPVFFLSWEHSCSCLKKINSKQYKNRNKRDDAFDNIIRFTRLSIPTALSLLTT